MVNKTGSGSVPIELTVYGRYIELRPEGQVVGASGWVTEGEALNTSPGQLPHLFPGQSGRTSPEDWEGNTLQALR